MKTTLLIPIYNDRESLKKLIEYMATNEDTNVTIDKNVDTYISNLNDHNTKFLLN